jgi:RimJ/RimL family protein N-acetyltransferase
MTEALIAPRTYPWTATVENKQINFRRMGPEDRQSMLAFAKLVPEDDLLFLTFDLTDPQQVDQWMEQMQAGRVDTIVAELDGRPVGYGSLSHHLVHWTRHLGEVWVMVSDELRGHGLGKMLVNEVFLLAQELGLQKVMVYMAVEQRAAQEVFQRLGFKPEALLADHVIDRNGRTHDLVIMTYDVTGFTEQ